MASHLCIEHDVVWGGLLYWELEALKATEYKEESEKMALFHVDCSAVSEARRETRCKVDQNHQKVAGQWWGSLSVEA